MLFTITRRLLQQGKELMKETAIDQNLSVRVLILLILIVRLIKKDGVNTKTNQPVLMIQVVQ